MAFHSHRPEDRTVGDYRDCPLSPTGAQGPAGSRGCIGPRGPIGLATPDPPIYLLHTYFSELVGPIIPSGMLLPFGGLLPNYPGSNPPQVSTTYGHPVVKTEAVEDTNTHIITQGSEYLIKKDGRYLVQLVINTRKDGVPSGASFVPVIDGVDSTTLVVSPGQVSGGDAAATWYLDLKAGQVLGIKYLNATPGADLMYWINSQSAFLRIAWMDDLPTI